MKKSCLPLSFTCHILRLHQELWFFSIISTARNEKAQICLGMTLFPLTISTSTDIWPFKFFIIPTHCWKERTLVDDRMRVWHFNIEPMHVPGCRGLVQLQSGKGSQSPTPLISKSMHSNLFHLKATVAGCLGN